MAEGTSPAVHRIPNHKLRSHPLRHNQQTQKPIQRVLDLRAVLQIPPQNILSREVTFPRPASQ